MLEVIRTLVGDDVVPGNMCQLQEIILIAGTLLSPEEAMCQIDASTFPGFPLGPGSQSGGGHGQGWFGPEQEYEYSVPMATSSSTRRSPSSWSATRDPSILFLPNPHFDTLDFPPAFRRCVVYCQLSPIQPGANMLVRGTCCRRNVRSCRLAVTNRHARSTHSTKNCY